MFLNFSFGFRIILLFFSFLYTVKGIKHKSTSYTAKIKTPRMPKKAYGAIKLRGSTRICTKRHRSAFAQSHLPLTRFIRCGLLPPHSSRAVEKPCSALSAADADLCMRCFHVPFKAFVLSYERIILPFSIFVKSMPKTYTFTPKCLTFLLYFIYIFQN